jgi:hypothetical protein
LLALVFVAAVPLAWSFGGIQEARKGCWLETGEKNLTQSHNAGSVQGRKGLLQYFASWFYSSYANIDIITLPEDDQFLGLLNKPDSPKVINIR